MSTIFVESYFGHRYLLKTDYGQKLFVAPVDPVMNDVDKIFIYLRFTQ